MTREYVGRVTINGKQHEMVGQNRDAVAWALGTLADTASRMGWEVKGAGIMTQLRSSITGEIMREVDLL